MSYVAFIYFGSFQMILKGLRDLALNNAMKGYRKIAAGEAADGPVDELKAIISEVACDIHGYYVLKSSSDEPFRFFPLFPKVKRL